MFFELSIVIVNFNAGAHLASCLASIQDHAPGADIIVVDNASTDGSERAAYDSRLATRVPAFGLAAGAAAFSAVGAERRLSDQPRPKPTEAIATSESPLSRSLLFM